MLEGLKLLRPKRTARITLRPGFVCAAFIAAGLSAIAAPPSPSPSVLRVLIDPKPITLDPFRSADANSQKIGSLLFRGLTQIDADLEVRPDLAARWSVTPDGKALTFTWPTTALFDENSLQITPHDMKRCVESYLAPNSLSPHRGAFPAWESAQASATTLTLRFKEPDPYALRNLSLLRFFRIKGIADPCRAPQPGAELITSGEYRLLDPREAMNPPIQKLKLLARRPGAPDFEFHFISDETAKIAALLRGQIDIVYSALGIHKTRWLVREHSDQFAFYNRPGVALQYLAFSARDPRLADIRVRQALALATDRDLILRTRLRDYAQAVEGFVPPGIAEGAPLPHLASDPEQARALLAQAGYSAAKPLVLEYRTTPSREGIELGQILQDQWSKVGVQLQLEVIEPAVFLRSLQKGRMGLYSSRWIGVSDGSILYRTLRTAQKLNRVGFSDPQLDTWLDSAMREPRPSVRAALLQKVQQRMREAMPYFPLWTWTQTLILRKSAFPRVAALGNDSERVVRLLSRSGALETVVRVADLERKASATP